MRWGKWEMSSNQSLGWDFKSIPNVKQRHYLFHKIVCVCARARTCACVTRDNRHLENTHTCSLFTLVSSWWYRTAPHKAKKNQKRKRRPDALCPRTRLYVTNTPDKLWWRKDEISRDRTHLDTAQCLYYLESCLHYCN